MKPNIDYSELTAKITREKMRAREPVRRVPDVSAGPEKPIHYFRTVNIGTSGETMERYASDFPRGTLADSRRRVTNCILYARGD